jgi:CRISPR type I-D-associated protein Csc1
MTLKAYRVTIEPHDFFFFATFDYRIGISQDAIHNYSLMYALWKNARFASAYTPHYLEDLATMEYYATPARPIGEPDMNRRKKGRPTHFDLIKVTYNSISELSTERMEKTTVNVPASSSYYKFPPLTCYEFFLLSNEPMKSIIRIGKKFTIARLTYEELSQPRRVHDTRNPDHLVNLRDIRNVAKFRSGRILYGFPSPLVADAQFESDYIQAEDNKKRMVLIQIPNTDFYKSLKGLEDLPMIS